MRELRFRCWNKDAKYMTPSFPIYKCTRDPSGKYIFLQCTGLKDKNSKDIYEGDIVKYCFESPCCDHPELNIAIVGEVVWEYAGFNIVSVKNGIFELDDIEVLGNRFQNPELLKED